MPRTKAHYEYEKKFLRLPIYERLIRPYLNMKIKKCESCGTKENLELHHQDYQNVSINTLKLLCKKCHKKEHKKLSQEFA